MDQLTGEEVLHEEHRHEERIMRESSKRNDYFLGASILLAALLVGGALVYSAGLRPGNTNGGAPVPPLAGGAGDTTPTILSTDVILGNPDAPITFFEFADYQCPFCAKFHAESSPQIRDNYIKTGKVKMVYRDFAFLGPESLEAAKAARCAQDQKKFWEYHDALYDAEHKDGKEHNGNLAKPLFLQLASNLKLNTDEFTRCLDTNKYADSIDKARTEAGTYGVESTPTLFVNDTKIVGAQPYSVFQAAFEAVLAKK